MSQDVLTTHGADQPGAPTTAGETTQATTAWLAENMWVIDLARAIFSIALGALILTELTQRGRAYLLFAALGVFLLVDGLVDVGATWRSVRHHAAERSRFLAGLLSVAMGIVTLVIGHAAIVLLIVCLGARSLLHGGYDIWRSISSLWRRETAVVGHGERFLWLSGLWRVLLGLVLIALADLLYLFLVAYFGFYLIADGAISLYSAVAKRRASVRHSSVSTLAPADAQVPIADPEQPNARRAVVFVRRSGANGLGHAGWAFEWGNGWFNVGSVENTSGAPYAPPDKMGFWTAQTLEPVATMLRKDPPYDEFKVFFVAEPRPRQAWFGVVWVSRIPYFLRGRNCVDCAYDVLREYGDERLRDPAQKNVPNEWYDSLPGLSYRVSEHPVIPLRPEAERREATVRLREIQLKPPSWLDVTPPEWRAGGGRARYELRERIEYINEETLVALRLIFAQAQRLIARVAARIRGGQAARDIVD